MRTPSIVFSILAIIALCSFRDSCHSETADAELRKKNRAQEIACIEQDISAKGVKDPREAVLYALQKQKEGYEEIDFPTVLAMEWYKKNPKEYMQWSRSLNEADFYKADKSVLYTDENVSSAEAEEFAKDQMAHGTKRNQSIFTIGLRKASSDPRRAAAWAESFSKDDPGRLAAVDGVAKEWAFKDPQAAIIWVTSISSTLPSGLGSSTNDPFSAAAMYCYDELYKVSPASALDWAIKNPNKGIAKPECFRIAGKWAKANREKPRTYILKTKESDLRRDMILGYISECSSFPPSDFPAIADWMLSVERSPFSPVEGDIFPTFLSTWIDKDRAGALEWLQKVPIHSEAEGTTKGNFIASILGKENPFTSGRFGRFRGRDSQLSTTDSSKENELVPGLNLKKLNVDGVIPSMKPLYIEVSRVGASNIMLSVLVALTLFNGFKIWKLSRASLIPKTVRLGVSILSVMFLLSFIIGLYPLIAKENISRKVQIIYIGAYCFSMILMTACFWIIANQAARGSRVLLVIGLLLTLLGLAGAPVAFLKKGNVAYYVSFLLWGAPILFCALKKASRDFRIQARSKKTQIPQMLYLSIICLVGVVAFYVIRDIFVLLKTDRTEALQIAWMFPLGIVLYVGPLLWALRWGDKVAFNLYRLFLTCVAVYVISLLYASFSNSSLIPTIINVVLTPAALVFLPSVRNWAKNLKPAF